MKNFKKSIKNLFMINKKNYMNPKKKKTIYYKINLILEKSHKSN